MRVAVRVKDAVPVATVEDLLQGKIWAFQDATRRGSKRQKDLVDIARLIETQPELSARIFALQMFLAAEKVHAPLALKIGLVDAVAEDPVKAALSLFSDSELSSS